MDPITSFFWGFGIALAGGLMVVLVRRTFQKTKISSVVIFTIVLFSLSGGLAGYLYASVKGTIDFKNSIAATEARVIEKLEIIREAEKVFLEQNGRYTSNWDTLINFIQNGEVPITVRKETVIPLSYGADSIYVQIDTIDHVPAKERIFKKTYTISAADNGTFLGFYVGEGDRAVKGAKSYKFKREGAEQPEEFTFLEGGLVSSVAKIEPGDSVTRGEGLISFWEYQFNPDIDISRLAYLPDSDKKFEIHTGKMERSGVWVNVIHVMDPDPVNPERSTANEAKNRQPLYFGSKTDVSTAGNWE